MGDTKDSNVTDREAKEAPSWEEVKGIINQLTVIGLAERENGEESPERDPFQNVDTFEYAKYFLELGYANKKDLDPRALMTRRQILHRFIEYPESSLYSEENVEKTWQYLGELCLRYELGSANVLINILHKDQERGMKRIGEALDIVFENVNNTSEENKEKAAIISHFLCVYMAAPLLKPLKSEFIPQVEDFYPKYMYELDSLEPGTYNFDNPLIKDIQDRILEKYVQCRINGMKRDEILESTLLGILIQGLSQGRRRLFEFIQRESKNNGDQKFIMEASERVDEIVHKLAQRELLNID